ncbi:tripartite tricarboxylate transporter substrate binding protein [soil metagenome]
MKQIDRKRRRFTAGAALSLALPAFHAAARAEAPWPARQIRLVVPFPPGGGTDTTSRLMAEKMASLGWTVVVDNRPGAAGNIGLDAVAKSAPDGYTIGMGQASNLAINPALYPTMPFNPLKDFTAIAPISEQPVVLCVREDSPLRTLADFVREAKANPGKYSIGQAGNGTVGHLAGELLTRRAGIQALQVPYKGAGPAMTDLLGGQIALNFANSVSVMSQLQAGKVRGLAVSSARRVPALPNVATVAEQGYPGFEATTWLGLVGPSGYPADLVARINRETVKILERPEVVERLNAEGSVLIPGTPQQFAELIQKEHAKWGALIRDANIKLE